jgi:hypothetical protein
MLRIQLARERPGTLKLLIYSAPLAADWASAGAHLRSHPSSSGVPGSRFSFANLGVEIERQATERDGEERSRFADARRQRDGNGPVFIEADQEQIGETTCVA